LGNHSVGKSCPFHVTIQSARETLKYGSSLQERIKRNTRKFKIWIRFQINIEIISDGCGSRKGRGPIKMRSRFEESDAPFWVGVDEENPGEF
jgi:hypothetical protein